MFPNIVRFEHNTTFANPFNFNLYQYKPKGFQISNNIYVLVTYAFYQTLSEYKASYSLLMVSLHPITHSLTPR